MEEDIQKALLHASDCELIGSDCVEEHCSVIKRKLAHYADAAVDHICAECLDVIDMCMRHALECGRGHTCTVPYCGQFRRRVDTSLARPLPEVADKLLREMEANIEKAAYALSQADAILVLTGAGYSNDSGLPVYKDIASVSAYREMGLTYQDLCQPEWIETDPDIFYGFWGTCFNDYRDATLHAGYDILKRWVRQRFGNNMTSQEIRMFVRSIMQENHEAVIPVAELPGAYFSITSNVDEHFTRGGAPEGSLWEIHGNTETWQCSVVCTENVWKAPKGYRFNVDKETMRAPPGPPLKFGEGDTRGFETNYPTCKYCGALARPSVLFFGDTRYIPCEKQRLAFAKWMEAVRDLASVRNLSLVLMYVGIDRAKNLRKLVGHAVSRSGAKKHVSLFPSTRKRPEWIKPLEAEIGAGIRVPTIRDQSHTILRTLRKAAILIRINPDFPVAPSDLEGQTISIMGNGLQSLQNIDKTLQALDSRIAPGYKGLPLRSTTPPSSTHSSPGPSPRTRRAISDTGLDLPKRIPPPAKKYISSSPYAALISSTTSINSTTSLNSNSDKCNAPS